MIILNIYLKAAEYISGIFFLSPEIFIFYFFAVNIVSFFIFYCDKQKAVKHKWRIPEATLLTFALIGGGIGAYSAMKIFRHKTKRPKFYIFVPIFIVLHLFIIATIFVGIIR